MISELMNSIFPWKAYAKQPIVSSLSGNIGNWVQGTRRVLRACAVRMIRQAFPSPGGRYMGFRNN